MRAPQVARRLALAAGLAGLTGLAGCYDVPKPLCGFRCGPEGACPEDYTCNESDGRCHLNSAPPTLVCGTVDASVGPLPDDVSGPAPEEPAQ